MLAGLGPGRCGTALPVAQKHLQQDGHVHAGVRATVLKPGKTLIVAESEIYAVRDGVEKRVAKATVTLAPVEAGK
jgi:acyl-coenzyme A thioesterase PaaI-like protein